LVGNCQAPSEENEDKDIRTHFVTAGVQYMFSRLWGVKLDVPYWDRHFTTADEGSGDRVSFDHSAIGDIRLRGIYTGFSEDLSTGITFGVKLPTGDFDNPHFDRDTSIGTGSTDLLLGVFHRGNLSEDGAWGFFLQGQLDLPVLVQDYRPGVEADLAGGVQYNRLSLGSWGKLTPIAQIIGVHRERDRGALADPANSGYGRILLSPGLEYDLGRVMVYGDAEFPVYQDVRGDQLIAPVMFKLTVAYRL
jgi:hypothetical protein